ncbi:prolipoprotein diacylglyceryl transferase [Rickettsiales bacterium]|nr:prolipoprotein diacylglyceryl transferase [Rickettsiales bacterium]
MLETHYVLPYIDPVLVSLGPLQIRWYSLAYILGIIVTILWLKHINKNQNLLSKKAYDSWISWAVLSIIIGGRLGYVLFYNFNHYLNNPLEILAFWHGGMSFHGGLIGAIFGMFLFCRKYQINFLQFTDIIAIIAPIGLFFGRIANFINMELYGRFTESKFGIIFPGAGNYPRHPSQLYEAFFEGILLFIILFFCYKKTKLINYRGKISGIFLAFYGSARFVVEFFREPDYHIGFILPNLTMGQILSVPLIIGGLYLLFSKKFNIVK